MRIDTKYDVGEIVYLKTDNDQLERLITRISISKQGETYELSCGTVTSWHYDFEFRLDRDIVKVTSN